MEINHLVERYNNGESINQIAKSVGWHYSTTRERLKRVGCKFRTVSEGVHLAKCVKPFQETEKYVELIDGLLLGDAYIERGNVGSRLILMQSIDHYGWIKLVTQLIDDIGTIESLYRFS